MPSGAGAGRRPDAHHEIEGHDGIEQQRHHLRGARVVDDLVDLERDERERDADGEVLGPALLREEADAFRGEERCVEEAAEAHLLELLRGQSGDLSDEPVQVVAVVLDADEVGGTHQERRRLMVHRDERRDADTHQDRHLDELSDADDGEPDVALAVSFGPFGAVVVAFLLIHLAHSPVPEATERNEAGSVRSVSASSQPGAQAIKG